MWRRFLFILKLFYKIKFILKNPEKHEMVIFDDIALYDLENLISKYNFFVLPNRIDRITKIYLTFKDLLDVNKYYLNIYFYYFILFIIYLLIKFNYLFNLS